MHFRPLSIAAVLVLTLAGAVRAADDFKVDAVHSSVVFKIKHLNTGDFWGRFNKISGTISYDESDPTKSQLSFSVPVDSLDTNNSKRDSDVKGPDLFSAKEFKEISFKSTEVKSAGDNKLEVAGQLTMHGQTKPLTVTMERSGPHDTKMQGVKIGLSTTFTVKRSDFGMNAMQGALGDEVEVHVGIEAGKR